jgi:hypothetical protein
MSLNYILPVISGWKEERKQSSPEEDSTNGRGSFLPFPWKDARV